jgi:hypothetical protein
MFRAHLYAMLVNNANSKQWPKQSYHLCVIQKSKQQKNRHLINIANIAMLGPCSKYKEKFLSDKFYDKKWTGYWMGSWHLERPSVYLNWMGSRTVSFFYNIFKFPLFVRIYSTIKSLIVLISFFIWTYYIPTYLYNLFKNIKTQKKNKINSKSSNT